ncbi:hypothetical protein JSY36_00705 [Bacillus sp. H-16]|uniref:putative amidoligase domain-containing protein n=1 Tax=Alteribacter salitolerans TaxID=2912333 RepID=UPI0019631F5C|nr:hypothetical protein [Alteribacter salitolerans]MBM7094259.1 hypothetical protein [Alteribacter salitolerans]
MNRLEAFQLDAGEENRRFFRMEVRSFEYEPESVSITSPYQERQTVSVHQLKNYYMGQEMIDTAFRAAYAQKLPGFYCKLQREGKKIIITDLKENTTTMYKRKIVKEPVTFGADVEYMILCKKTGMFQSLMINRDKAEEHTDGALIRKGHTFYKPVFELHPAPGFSSGELHENLLTLFSRQEKRVGNSSYETISTSNPRDRFFLGGHLHFGNLCPSFKKTSQLDTLVALPMSLVDGAGGKERRNSRYGGLGNVRSNSFNGFEYRTLSSWYGRIPGSLMMFNWVEWVVKNELLPYFDIPDAVVRSYHSGDLNTAEGFVQNVFQSLIKKFPKPGDKKKIEDFYSWVAKARIPLS